MSTCKQRACFITLDDVNLHHSTTSEVQTICRFTLILLCFKSQTIEKIIKCEPNTELNKCIFEKKVLTIGFMDILECDRNVKQSVELY